MAEQTLVRLPGSLGEDAQASYGNDGNGYGYGNGGDGYGNGYGYGW